MVVIKCIASFLFYLFSCVLWLCMILLVCVIVLFVANTTYYDLTGVDVARELGNAQKRKFRSKEDRSNSREKD